jgi:glycosyltransferase involved in cell wall biosynthesis
MLSSGNYVPLEKMPRFYNQLHCYVCASSSEGYSLSVLEAAATGNVIITTAVGGTDELIKDGENGFIVDRNVDRIAQKIRFLKDNPDVYQQMSENMSSWVKENWCWSKRHLEWVKFIKRNV